MRNKTWSFALGFASGLIFLIIGALGYLRIGFAGVRADVLMPPTEKWLITRAIYASVHRRAESVSDQAVFSDEELVAGGKLYLRGCAGCHRAPGSPRRDSRQVFSYPPIPELPYVGTAYSNAEVFWIIKHGIRRTGMPAWGAFRSDKEIWAVAAFVKRIDNLPPGVWERIKQ